MRITYCASCLILFLLTSVPELKAQPDFGDIQYFDEKVFDDRIKTVLLHKEGWNLSYPVIKLKSSDRLILKFDLFFCHDHLRSRRNARPTVLNNLKQIENGSIF
ncbi:MAG: DUF5103 domain-containing protein [Bacteroidales bacterium]|nr:DUF5103 domain-containing protein [Bacteroidales bacterium]